VGARRHNAFRGVNHLTPTVTWTELCSWIHDCFGHDQHEALIRQLFHIKQISSVQDYIDKFIELIDQLLAYEPAANQCYYTTCFVDGLRDEIKSVILVQSPIDLDTACSFALLQEETDVAHHRDYHRPDRAVKPKPYSGPTPLPLPPPYKLDKSLGGGAAEKHHVADVNHVGPAHDKVVALHAYRKARGLC
jgi:hypothetical protein